MAKSHVECLMGHGSKDVPAQGRVAGPGGQFHCDIESLERDGVLTVVEGHPARDVGELGGGREHGATGLFVCEASPEESVSFMLQVFVDGPSAVPAPAPLVHA